MSYYALKDSDWAFDDQDEGRAIVVQADTPEEAISKATAMHIKEIPGAGGVTWEVARLDLVGIGDAEWDDDNQPKFEAFRFYEEGLNAPSETCKRIKALEANLEADNAAQAARIKELEEATSNQKEMYHKQIDFAGELQRLLWALKEGNELPEGAKDSHAYTVASLIKDRFSKLEKKCVRLHSENKKMRMSKYYDRLGRCEARVSELVEQLVNSEQKKEALEAKLAAAEKALEPFADIADLVDAETEGMTETDELVLHFHDYEFAKWPVSFFREARAVLGGKPS